MIWWLASAHAEVGLSTEPAVGEEITVTLTDDSGAPVQGATVRVVHRPGLTDATEVAVGITDARGEALWVPDTPGTATLIAGEQELPVAIAWPGPPADVLVGLALLLAASLAAAGYALFPPRR